MKRTRVACDVATVLRRHQFVAKEAAIELWRQGVSGLDIALASSLSDPQRLDLIDAVDKLVNRRNLSNRKEKIMSPDNNDDRTEFGPTVVEQDEENDKQREVADENLADEAAKMHEGLSETFIADPDLAILKEDDPADSQLALEAAIDEENAKDPSGEDTARLHVALKDPHTSQDGYVSEPVEADQTPEERQADLDKCCGTDPVADPVGSASDLDLYKLEAFGAINEKKNQLQPDDHGLIDPDRERLTVDPLMPPEPEVKHPTGSEIRDMYQNTDRERLTGVDHILNKKESPAAGTAAEVEHLIRHDRARSCCHRSGIREGVYGLIDGERDYQDKRFDQTSKLSWTPNDWLTLMDRYMIDALDIIADPDVQMVELRKIAALAVAAMEHILTPARM